MAWPEGKDLLRSCSNCSAPGGRARPIDILTVSLTVTPAIPDIASSPAAARWWVSRSATTRAVAARADQNGAVTRPIACATSTGQPSGSAQPRVKSVRAVSNPSSTCDPVDTAIVRKAATDRAATRPMTARRWATTARLPCDSGLRGGGEVGHRRRLAERRAPAAPRARMWSVPRAPGTGGPRTGRRRGADVRPTQYRVLHDQTCHRPAATRRPVPRHQRVPACRRPARRDRRDLQADRGRGQGRRAPRRDRHRQVRDHGMARGEAPAPHAGDGPEQDPGSSAGQRVPRAAARQRGGVLRLVLRLLPA